MNSFKLYINYTINKKCPQGFFRKIIIINVFIKNKIKLSIFNFKNKFLLICF